MKKYVCTVYGYVYDPEAGVAEEGIKPGTSFEDYAGELDLTGFFDTYKTWHII